MGALMVVDPQHTARYQPARLYINRLAPKKQRLVRERETKKIEKKRNTKKPEELSGLSPELPYQK
jgi:hypothetical protein